MENPELWDRLGEFSVDRGEPELSFVDRLAREHCWPDKLANRAYQEYLRFLYLVCISPSECTPSDIVDEVWHQHLIYSESYWIDLREITGMAIHHRPTRGGVEESDKYRHAYEETLELYQREFDARPPHHIWPAVDKRFDEALSFRRIKTAGALHIPRPMAIAVSLAFGFSFISAAGIANWSELWGAFENTYSSLGVALIPYAALSLSDRGSRPVAGDCGGWGGGCGGCAGCGGS